MQRELLPLHLLNKGGKSATMQTMKSVYDWTYKVVMFICKILLIADILEKDLSLTKSFRRAGDPQRRPHPHDQF